jgi:hypothetical protein
MEMAQFHEFKQRARLTVRPLGKEDAPGWATGLRQLYKAALEEPLPGDFGDLMARLEGRSAPDPSTRRPSTRRL